MAQCCATEVCTRHELRPPCFENSKRTLAADKAALAINV